MNDPIKDALFPPPPKEVEPAKPELRGSSLNSLGAGDSRDLQRIKDNSYGDDPMLKLIRSR